MTQSLYREPRVAGGGSAGHGVAVGRARPSARRLTFAAWAMLGFALGVSFWHAVGFLGFLEDLVVPRSVLATDIVRGAGDADSPKREVAQNCTTMMRSRETGRTWARPCVAILQKPGDHSQSGSAQPALPTAGRLDLASSDE